MDFAPTFGTDLRRLTLASLQPGQYALRLVSQLATPVDGQSLPQSLLTLTFLVELVVRHSQVEEQLGVGLPFSGAFL